MKRNIFTENISCWTFAPWLQGAQHHITTIGEFLHHAQAGTYADTIKQCRQEIAEAWESYRRNDTEGKKKHLDNYKALKASNPVAMLAGINAEQKKNTFTHFSNVLCLDIDAPKPSEEKGNRVNEVTDWEEIKQRFAVLPWVAFSALSAGGRGVFVLVPIQDAEKYSQYYKVWAQKLERVGLYVDEACTNQNRLRYMTHDPNPIVNEEAEVWVWEKSSLSNARAQREPYEYNTRNALSDTDRMQVIEAVQYCEKNHTPIAEDYNDWLRLSAFFAHCFADAEGQNLFHRLASLSEKYRERENDKLYYNLNRPSAVEVGYGTFVQICKSHGIPIHTNRKRAQIINRPWQLKKQEGKFVQEGGKQKQESPSLNVTGEEQAEATPPALSQSEKNILATSQSEGNILATPQAQLSQSERNILQRAISSGYIAEGEEALKRMQTQNPNISDLCEGLGLHYAGHERADGKKWYMTQAQFEALLFPTNVLK